MAALAELARAFAEDIDAGIAEGEGYIEGGIFAYAEDLLAVDRGGVVGVGFEGANVVAVVGVEAVVGAYPYETGLVAVGEVDGVAT